jgi:ABC-type Fe3+/spermidine/putrescine transport system ATPase subunit
MTGDQSSRPALELVHVSRRFGERVAADDVNLSLARGEFFTLLGPSGSGKSTLLRLIAGLEHLESGSIRVDGREVQGVPPWQRGIGMVFQQYALFPHMNVAQNLAYGLRIHKVGHEASEERIRSLLKLVGLDGSGRRPVVRLSGGEQQRVALARSLAMEPPILLLDEPLGSLDEKIRREMQVELKQIQRRSGTTFLYVTHDQEEALTMSDRVAVMHSGRILQCDEPEAIFRRPSSRFVATFFKGCNVLRGQVASRESNRVRMKIADTVVPIELPAGRDFPGGEIAVGLRAENVRLGERSDQCSMRLEAVVQTVIYRGTTTDHVLELSDGQTLTATTTHVIEGVRPGAKVQVGVMPDDFIPLLDE